MSFVPGHSKPCGRFDEVNFLSFHLRLPLVRSPANLTHKHMTNPKGAEIPLTGPEFRLWAGPDGLALRDRALAGELWARRELELRWDAFQELEDLMHLSPDRYLALLRLWFSGVHSGDPDLQRTHRAIRRNRRKVPDPEALRAVFSAPTPEWSDAEIFRAWARLRRGARPKVARTSLMAERVLGRRRGRPARYGVPAACWRDARHALKRMIRAQRRHRVDPTPSKELAALYRCGVILTAKPVEPLPSPQELLSDGFLGSVPRPLRSQILNAYSLAVNIALPPYRAPEGEACTERRDGEMRPQRGEALWFELFWQAKLFWCAVGVAPPGIRELVQHLGVEFEYEGGLKRADRAATWFLERVFSHAGRSWRPRQPIVPRAKKQAESEAAEIEAMDREMERLVTSGGVPSRALVERAMSTLGVGRPSSVG